MKKNNVFVCAALVAACVLAFMNVMCYVEDDLDCELTITQDGQGTYTVVPASATGMYPDGTQVTITAKADSNWTFAGFRDADGELITSDTYTFDMAGDKTVAVEFRMAESAGGSANFSASKISAGRYLVDVREMKAGKRYTSAVVLR